MSCTFFCLLLLITIILLNETIYARKWFIHKHPTWLSIEGREMYLMFTSIFDFNKKVINAIVRLYHTMDDELYATYKETRCRHFLPCDFAVMSNIW